MHSFKIEHDVDDCASMACSLSSSCPLMRMFTNQSGHLGIGPKWIVIVDLGVEIGRAAGVVFSNSLQSLGRRPLSGRA
ncbi:MAG: hypothetical protein MZU97_00215 [Bacillus subtilis]|nr:hypothetical protein [Bacillus subtilis]